MRPEDIEQQSFRIIDEEAGSHGFDQRHWPVVRRMIHTSADFEYLKSVRFHPDAISAGITAIRSGKPIITDTHMARIGIRQRDLAGFGGQVRCFMTDPATLRLAAENGTTRARAAVDVAAGELAGGIFAVGNAPTALLRVMERMEQGDAAPALVVGLPVGFVNAAESKAKLMTMDTPFITNVGRKGGSTVAAAVINALILMARQEMEAGHD